MKKKIEKLNVLPDSYFEQNLQEMSEKSFQISSVKTLNALAIKINEIIDFLMREGKEENEP